MSRLLLCATPLETVKEEENATLAEQTVVKHLRVAAEEAAVVTHQHHLQ